MPQHTKQLKISKEFLKSCLLSSKYLELLSAKIYFLNLLKIKIKNRHSSSLKSSQFDATFKKFILYENKILLSDFQKITLHFMF